MGKMYGLIARSAHFQIVLPIAGRWLLSILAETQLPTLQLFGMEDYYF